MRRLFRIFKRFFAGLVLAGVLFLLFIGGIFFYYLKTLPSPESLAHFQVTESTKIYDRTGNVLLYDVYGEQKRTLIPAEEISPLIIYATVVAEDDDFYHHFGIDLKGVVRAILANVRGRGIVQGGSTITQQFVKNAFLSSEQTFSRKIKEVILSLELELNYSKDQIMSWYLNQVPYGSNSYGVEAAAQTFFNKHAKDLTLAEAASIAALPRAPTFYSPYGSHLEELTARQQYILKRMKDLRYITEEEYGRAMQEKITFAKDVGGIKTPHFVMYVKEYLEEVYGKEYLQSAGLQIRTTLDWNLQKKAEEIVEEVVQKNRKKYQSYNASFVAIDPHTGQILAMVGSQNYFGEPLPKGCAPGKTCLFDPNVNVAVRPRQPGSSFKPFAYSQAFIRGYTPDTIVFDVPTEFVPTCAPDGSQEKDANGLSCYHPQNYTGTFRGPITLKEALAQSINIPAIKTLYLAGIQETVELAKTMGIKSLKDPSRYGLSLVLGGGEVTLLEETSAYGVFAAEGVLNPYTAILSIADNKGTIVDEYKASPRTVLNKKITDAISGILSSDQLRAPVFGANGILYTPGVASAVKTGTTQNSRDAWTVGYTQDIVAGAWAGNNDGTFMRGAGGSSAAAPIWKEFIMYLYDADYKPEGGGFVVSKRTSLPGLMPSQTGKPVLDGNFSGLVSQDGLFHSILYYINKNSPVGEGNSQDDVQFPLWEYAIKNWAKQSSPDQSQETSSSVGGL